MSFESYPWDQNMLAGTYATILVCALAVTCFAFAIAALMTFFIASGLQFDAFRVYMEGLVVELDEAIVESAHAVEFQLMFKRIICFHVAAKE